MVRTDVATTASSAHGDHHGQDNFVALLCSLIVPACLSSAIPHGSIGSVRLSPENITGVAIALAGQTGTALNPGVPAEGRLGSTSGEGAPRLVMTSLSKLQCDLLAQQCAATRIQPIFELSGAHPQSAELSSFDVFSVVSCAWVESAFR